MRINPSVELGHARRWIVSTLTGLAVALTVVQLSNARKQAPAE